MALSRPTVLPVWADSGSKTQPTNAEVDVGWPLSSVPPSRQRFNWLSNYLMNGVRYLTRRGIADHDMTDSYEIGDKVLGSDGHTYRSLITANVGFNPALVANQGNRWVRWGFTLADIMAYMRTEMYSPTICPATGPAAVPSTSLPWIYWASTLGELWMWSGTAWRVTAKLYRKTAFAASNGIPAGVTTAIMQITPDRPGRARLRGIFSALSGAGGITTVQVSIRRVRSGVTTILDDAGAMFLCSAASQTVLARPETEQDVLMGDVFYLIATPDQILNAHPTNANSLYIEYVQ